MNPIEKANKLYKKVNTFILTCIGEDGYPYTKAVSAPKHRESLKEIYFCTNTSSKFVGEIRKNEKTCVYFYRRKLVWKGCILKGTMEIVTDMDIKVKFWQKKFKNAYSQKSFTDPDYCVIRFIPNQGRFYSWFKPEDFEI